MTEMGEESYQEDTRKITEQIEEQKAYERKQKREEKRIAQIEASNTWKLGRIIQSLQNLFKPNKKSEQKIEALQQELIEREKELEKLETKLIPLQFLNEQLSNYQIREEVRQLKEDGKLLKNLEAITKQKHQLNENYKRALHHTARLYMNEEKSRRNAIYKSIIEHLPTEEIPEFMVRAGLDEKPISLRHTASFRSSLSMRMRQLQLIGTLPEWSLDDKRTAYDFVKQFDIVVPELDEAIYTIETLPEREASVVKPVDAAGARGVYLIHNENDIFDVRKAKRLTSFTELKEAMKEDLKSAAVEEDAWLVEELIYENKSEKLPARDIKFYSFYGKVALILEIIRDPEIRHTWWTRDGKRITTNKYEASLLAGQGVSEREIERVEQLSEAIPAPFLRIDFLQGETGLVFGEFTPKPGNYDDFDQTTDAWLGDYFIEAEQRLVEDLLQGKNFPEYHRYIKTIENEKLTM